MLFIYTKFSDGQSTRDYVNMKVWGEFVIPRKNITRAPATSKIRYLKQQLATKVINYCTVC